MSEQENKRSWLKRLRSSFRRPAAAQVEESRQERISPEINHYNILFAEQTELFDSLKQSNNHHAEGLDLLKIETIIETLEKDFEQKGVNDGALGLSKEHIKAKARTHVRLIKDTIVTNFKGTHEQYKVEEQATNLEVEWAEKAKEQNEEILNQSFYHPKKFSLVLGLLYLPISIFLILADIPLALKLTQEGFNLDLSEDAKIKDLMTNFYGVIAQNWEVFILSLGIALCTIYIKILYDEYLASPLSKTILKYRRIPNIPSSEIEEHKEKLNKELRIRKIVSVVVLAFLLLTIIFLGFFRYVNDPALQDSGGGKAIITLITFILITLIFPVIGGISFAIGLENLQNFFRAFYHRYFRKKEVERRFLDAKKSSRSIKEKLKRVDEYLSWCEGEKFEQEFEAFCIASYNRGYEKGSLIPDRNNNGRDLFERVEKLRNKAVSRRVFNSVLKLNPNSFNHDSISNNNGTHEN